MSTDLDLKQTQKESYKLAAHADGTGDLSMGLIFMLLGLFPITRAAFGPSWNMVFYLASLALISFVFYRLRAWITPQRIGVVKFGPQIKQRKQVALLITILLAAGMIALWVLSAQGWFPSTPDWLAGYGIEIIAGLIILGIFWGVAYTVQLRRYYFYGVMLAVCFPLQGWLDSYEALPFLLAGGIITVIGAILLTRFLKKYPVMEGSEVSGD